MTPELPQCYTCKHFHFTVDHTCDAFPHGIPEAFILYSEPHEKPVAGESIVYERLNDEQINLMQQQYAKDLERKELRDKLEVL